MRKRIIFLSVIVGFIGTMPAHSDDTFFTGDVRLSCEAVLCLSSGTRPSECSPSLKRYFSINHKKLSDTINARRDFLKICPASNQDDKMRTLVNDISNGAGRCDAASLNLSLMAWNWNSDERIISNKMPDYCSSYANNTYTDINTARYVGTPENGGYWVESENYEQAVLEYNATAAQRQHRQQFVN